MIPAQHPGQSFDEHQADMAAWLGCSVAEMNDCHDRLHRTLAGWLGIPSHSMANAAGEPFDAELAELEEVAVLHVQRWMAHAGVTLL